ncbi:hypothetical protein [Planctopirus hydrillae]|uniref:hypothetical protein n=1 Tax=Planctopirus hydrillae TaxID=1841610 RepID=UPI0010420247|nr:hypothetical protein [Planctopirus hydrillae]
MLRTDAGDVLASFPCGNVIFPSLVGVQQRQALEEIGRLDLSQHSLATNRMTDAFTVLVAANGLRDGTGKAVAWPVALAGDKG